jgi:hopanoid biosynthesis associated RND transporter like protein HpnN
VFVAGALAAISAFAFVTRIEYRTQRSDLMSPDKDYQQRWQRHVAEFGDDDDIVLIVEGGDPERRRAVIDQLAEDIGHRPELFERLLNRVDLRPLRNRALLFLTTDEIASILDNLKRMGPLLNGPLGAFAWRQLNLVHLLRDARLRIERWDSSQPIPPPDLQFLSQLLAVVKSAGQAMRDPADYRNPWGQWLPRDRQALTLLDEPQYLQSDDGRLAYLLVRPVKDAASFTPVLESVRGLRQIVEARRGEFSDLEFGLTGLPVLESDEMESSQAGANRAGWIALAGVALLYFVVYRCLRLPLISVGTLLVGTLWSMGWLTLTVGHLNILSACFAVMLIGLGDYGVLWQSHYEARRKAGDAVADAARSTALTVGPGIITAACSTALAFFAAMLADFQAVAELGWIAGCGVLFCALSTFTFLPAIVALTDRRGYLGNSLRLVTLDGESRLPGIRNPQSAIRNPAWLPGLANKPRWVLAAGLLAAVTAGVFATRARYDHNLLNLQSPDSPAVHWAQRFLNTTTGAGWCALSHASTREEAQALKEQYERLPEVSRVVEIASLLPVEQERKLPMMREIAGLLNRLPSADRGVTPAACSPSELQHECDLFLRSLAEPIHKLGFPILNDIALKMVVLRETSGQCPQTQLDQFGQRLVADLLADLHKLRSATTANTIEMSDLPAELRGRYVGQSGQWLVQAFAKEGLWEIEPLKRFVSAARTVDPDATGKPFGTLEGLLGMQRGFAWAGIYSLAVIVLVLLADFRSLMHTLLALLPLAIGSVVTVGVMAICGVAFNPANMIALPLIVGVGVDNGVHVLHDYLGLRGGPYVLNRSTGAGVAVAALTTVLGFGALMTAGHRGLVSLGFVLALGVTSSMIAALVVLPAMLRLMSRESKITTAHTRPRAAA